MILTAGQQSHSPDTFGDDMKMFAKTGSTTSSGYCSSPQASDESFDGDKLDYFGSSSYKMWGDSNTNSEHIAHNILSQLFEEERSKSPVLPNALSGDSGIVWSNDFQNASETQSSPLSAFSDETTESAFIQWGCGGAKQLAPGSHLTTQNSERWPTSLHTPNNTSGGHFNTPTNNLQQQFPSHPYSVGGSNPQQHFNSNNTTQSHLNNSNTHFNSNAQHFSNSSNNNAPQQHYNNMQPASAALGLGPLNGGMPLSGGSLAGIPNGNGMLGGMPAGNGMPGGMPGGGGAAFGGYMGNQRGMTGMVQPSRAMGGLPPVDVLQQSILRRKIAEQAFMSNIPDARCFPSSPNKLYPTSPTSISLSHHKKLPLSFTQIENPIPSHQPQISPDSKLLLNAIETCWSQLLQLNREEKKCEYEVSVLFKDFVKPVSLQAKPKSPFKLDLLIQNTESTHAVILSLIENVEKVSQNSMKMKGNIVQLIASLDEICREMLELRRQIHPVHGMGNDETIRKLIQTLELYSKQTKSVRSNLFMMGTILRNNSKKN